MREFKNLHIQGQNVEEVRESVVNEMCNWGYPVVGSEEEVVKWLASFYEESEDDIYRQLGGESCTIWHEDEDGCEYRIDIRSHYVDSGSVDYVYTVEVN